jgi:hypothetical protein
MSDNTLLYYTGVFDSCGFIYLCKRPHRMDNWIHRSLSAAHKDITLLRGLRDYFGYGKIDYNVLDGKHTWVLDKKDFISDFCSRVGFVSIIYPVDLDIMLKSCSLAFGSVKSLSYEKTVKVHEEMIEYFNSNSRVYPHLTFSSPPECEWLSGYIDGSIGKVAFLDREENKYYFAEKLLLRAPLKTLIRANNMCLVEIKNKKVLAEYLQQLIPFLSLEKESVINLLNSLTSPS